MSAVETNMDRPTIRIPGNGLEFQLFDSTVTCTVAGEDTGGAYSVFEQALPVGGVVPLCRARSYEMVCYVLEGAVSIRIGGQTILAEPGTIVRIPRRTVFGFKNAGIESARFLCVVTPGGLERLLEAWWDLTADERRDRARIAELLESRGVEVLPDEPRAVVSRYAGGRRVEGRLCAALC